MAGKPSKKGRNPGVVDNWLDNLELYRKNVAYDETCLFRAVSEQLFECQIFHERVRRECIEYGKDHFNQFMHLIDNEEKWYNHLNLLENHMVICGNLEINLISRKYNRDVLIFHANKQQIYDVTKLGLPSPPLMLCLMDKDHYDAVYRKEHIENSGFCQSMVYKTLYENVFKIPKVDDIVKAMLYEKTQVISQSEMEEKSLYTEGSIMEDLENTIVAPFPFKVAKALDPTIYRNIEYDSWGEIRRELRLGDWYYGDDKLKMGTRCLLTDRQTGDLHECYIQDLLKNQNQCVVYLTKIAEKRIVNYSDLSPESDAKPWPLPYRFSKNLVITNTTTQLAPMDKVKSLRKKNKEKRQSKSLTDIKCSCVDGESLEDQMQMANNNHNNNNNDNETTKIEASTDTTELVLPQTEGLLTPVTPEINQYPQRYHWGEPVHWPVHQTQYIPPDNSYYSPTADPFVWPQSPPAGPYYEYKPMVASAPVTPNVVPYHDTNYPFFFNYHVEQYPLPPQSPSTPTANPIMNRMENSERTVETSQMVQTPTFSSEHNVPTTTPCLSPLDSVPKVNLAFMPQPAQSIDLYHPIMPVPPGTPIIYTPIPTEADVMVNTPNVNPFTPTTPVEMQYISPQGYVYPSAQTLPSIPVYTHAGYPYNPQGFVFPQPNQAK
ncbi:uncharacterized protein LOC115879113 isoform X2 [Sitophilus oryzae]|uniref:Uncharacterized protein LOC115879113 isoform X2 n=1 Tax=Sitophilus oryzae TaxID=7048 RepID=A0A6J2XL58_SITOR|nr:uncharacterized protein LOC115879113 isoform X2 [Sitophilus oryzae]